MLAHVAHVVSISILVPIMSFIPGFMLCTFLRERFSLEREELIAASFGISFLLLGSVAFIGFLMGCNDAIFSTGFFLIFVVVFYALGNKAYRTRQRSIGNGGSIFMPLFFLLYYFHLVCVQSAIPIYASGDWHGDWWMHYEISKIYLAGARSGSVASQWWSYPFFARTPFFNLINAYFLSILGNPFWTFQIVSSLINSCFVMSLYLVAKRIFDAGVAQFCLALAFFNPALIKNALYTWPKLLCAYFILLSYFYYLKIRKGGDRTAPDDVSFTAALAGLFSGLAYMSHQLAAFYIIAIAWDHLFLGGRGHDKASGNFLRVFFVPFLCVVVPWHLWAGHMFGLTRMAKDWALFNSMDAGFSVTAKAICFNAFASLVPYQSILHILQRGLTAHSLYSALILCYGGTLCGQITISASILVLLSSMRALIDGKWRGYISRALKAQADRPHAYHVSASIFFFLGFAGGVLGARAIRISIGTFASTAFPSVAILLVYVSALISGSRWGRWVVGGAIVEFILAVWVQTFFVVSGIGWKTDGNWLIKAKYHTMFVRDYIGSSWIFFAAAAVVIEVLVARWLVRETKGRAACA